jgi:hypothetical protein
LLPPIQKEKKLIAKDYVQAHWDKLSPLFRHNKLRMLRDLPPIPVPLSTPHAPPREPAIIKDNLNGRNDPPDDRDLDLWARMAYRLAYRLAEKQLAGREASTETRYVAIGNSLPPPRKKRLAASRSSTSG